MIRQDGSVEDVLGIVKELEPRKGQIIIQLGNNGGIGRVMLGTYKEFSIYQA
ncbi:MAG: hypothetical protein H6765_04105 [Candidatus Peribacteria bacterium]|nr:MAG: hypothetical protein H6765_04105 [Candidatus Peribacteria bacterium]